MMSGMNGSTSLECPKIFEPTSLSPPRDDLLQPVRDGASGRQGHRTSSLAALSVCSRVYPKARQRWRVAEVNRNGTGGVPPRGLLGRGMSLHSSARGLCRAFVRRADVGTRSPPSWSSEPPRARHRRGQERCEVHGDHCCGGSTGELDPSEHIREQDDGIGRNAGFESGHCCTAVLDGLGEFDRGARELA